MRYALIGHGRMGRAIDEQAAARGHHRVAVVDAAGRAEGSALDREWLAAANVAFEFTVPDAAEGHLLELLGAGVPVVCGTTGWKPSSRLRDAVEASSAGIVLAPNFSIGMNLFFRVVDHAARLFASLGLHEPYVEEAHHRGKLDVPSGTARRLAAILLEADPRLSSVQEGNPQGVLPDGTLQVVSRRAGREPGVHVVGFDGEQDVVTLRHGARGRSGFALGAVLAAEWIAGRRGLHTFEEVLDEILSRSTSPSGDAPKEA